MLPHDLQEEEDGSYNGPAHPHYEADHRISSMVGVQPRCSCNDPFSESSGQLHQGAGRLSSMSGPDISALGSELQLPKDGILNL